MEFQDGIADQVPGLRRYARKWATLATPTIWCRARWSEVCATRCDFDEARIRADGK